MRLLLPIMLAMLAMLAMAVAGSAIADARGEARAHFLRGMRMVEAGRYHLGITDLKRAYVAVPHPNVLYNIGLAHMYAGERDAALEYFERYRDEACPDDDCEVAVLLTMLDGGDDKPACWHRRRL